MMFPASTPIVLVLLVALLTGGAAAFSPPGRGRCFVSRSRTAGRHDQPNAVVPQQVNNKPASSTALIGQDGDAEDKKDGSEYDDLVKEFEPAQVEKLVDFLEAREAKLKAELKNETKELTGRMNELTRFTLDFMKLTYGYLSPIAQYGALEAMCKKYAVAAVTHKSKSFHRKLTLHPESVACECISMWIYVHKCMKAGKVYGPTHVVSTFEEDELDEKQLKALYDWKMKILCAVGHAIFDFAKLYIKENGGTDGVPVDFLKAWKSDRNNAAHGLGKENPELAKKILDQADNPTILEEISAQAAKDMSNEMGAFRKSWRTVIKIQYEVRGLDGAGLHSYSSYKAALNEHQKLLFRILSKNNKKSTIAKDNIKMWNQLFPKSSNHDDINTAAQRK